MITWPRRTSQQWLPLWNPLDQTGMPLLGETTTAVLYPVRYLIFALPLPTDVALSWYVVLHLILASFTSRWAALRSGASPWAASLAGVIYPLAGCVFFLYTNPPYLVGAAWLPLVLAALISREKMTATNRCLIAAPSMAMMILGGDPQTALHAMLVAAAVFVFRLRRPDAVGSRRATAISLLTIPLVAALLTAPQLAASLSWSSQSDRVLSQDSQPWDQPPASGTLRDKAFQFSLPPWHAASLLTPNALGRLFPVYQRISVIIPGDGRMWTPSIYLGLLAALAITGRCLRREFDVWMSIACVALLLCLGHFGIVWLLQQIPGVLAGSDSAIGGPYWFLYRLLPGYDSFRYPAKWLPVFALAVTMTTSLWIDSAKWRNAKTACVIVAVLLLAVVATISILCWQADSAMSIADVFWGPLDVNGAVRNLWWSAGHSLIALVAVGLGLRLLCGRRSPSSYALLIVIVALDLGLSNHQWLARVSRSAERAQVERQRQETPPRASRWLRMQSGSGWPSRWQDVSDRGRSLDVAASERLAWFGRWHLADRQAVLNNMTSIRSQQMAMFWQACKRVNQGKANDQQARFWQSIRRWLCVDGVLMTRSRAHEGIDANLVQVTRTTEKSGFSQFRFHADWLVQEAQDLDAFADFIQAVDRTGGDPLPMVRSSNQARTQNRSPQNAVYRLTPIGHDEVKIECDKPGLLSRPVLQDGHWIAEIRSADSQQWRSTRVQRVSFLKQGIMLSPGRWHVRFRYRPWWLPWSLLIAVAAWSAVGWICWLHHLPMQKRPKTRSRMSSV